MPKIKKDKNGQTNSINQVRYGCALGAMHSVSAIPGAIPITHCGPGCVDKQYMSLSFYNGYQGGGYSGGAVPPSSNLQEKDVVFGGAKHLDQLIEASLKILEGDLFVVLNGCIPEIVGDDIGAVVDIRKRACPSCLLKPADSKATTSPATKSSPRQLSSSMWINMLRTKRRKRRA